MKQLLYPGMIIALLATACKGEKHDKEIAQVDSLRHVLIKTDSLLKNFDADEAERMSEEIGGNSKFINLNLSKLKDTLDFKTGYLLNRYHQMLDPLEEMADSHKQLSAAVDSTRKSLDDLEHDLRNNSLAPGLTPEGCVEQESEQVSHMYEIASGLRPKMEMIKTAYDTLAPRVGEYLQMMNSKLAQQQQQNK